MPSGRAPTALTRLGTFSDTANQLIDESQADIVRNLRNLEPTVRAPRRCRPGSGDGSWVTCRPTPTPRSSSTGVSAVTT